MWTKNIYEEQMLAYLDEVEADIEQFAHFRLPCHELNELYVDLDVAVKRLWWLIGANDADWEGFRYPLELSCDRLQRALYRYPRAGTLTLPTSVTMSEHQETWLEFWETAVVL
ncbi:MAG: hypothetical protein GC204_02845 [Chloroflexi bacterium]|nr:hypothetical protein [Chloroflexota bacterium]